MEEKKDYSLLRPFDLEAAKRGEAICTAHGDAREYVAGPDYMDGVCAKGSEGGLYIHSATDLRMAPLAWVEGKPVYKVDVLYCIVGKPDAVTVKGLDISESALHTSPSEGCCLFTAKKLTWTPPKVKRDGFVCIVKTDKIAIKGECADVIVRNCSIFQTHEAANAWADQCGDVVAIAPISWEEPAS